MTASKKGGLGIVATTEGRVDTTAQSDAAEQLVVAELGMRGLIAAVYPRSFADADVYAFDRERERVVRIQVKYRHRAGATKVIFRRGSLDHVNFVVFIRANEAPFVAMREGFRQTWVAPATEVAALCRPDGDKDSVSLSVLKDEWLNNWDSILVEARRA